MAALAGMTMTAGFTRRVAEVAGGRAGAAYFVDAAIEIARLARQVTRMPPALVARHLAEGPVGHWRLDMQGWVDLPVSCYTYRPESEATVRRADRDDADVRRPVRASGRRHRRLHPDQDGPPRTA